MKIEPRFQDGPQTPISGWWLRHLHPGCDCYCYASLAQILASHQAGVREALRLLIQHKEKER